MTAADTKVIGAVVDARGRPVPVAAVRLMIPGEVPSEAIAVDGRGRFALPVAHHGFAWLELETRDRRPQRFALLAAEPTTRVQIRLSGDPGRPGRLVVSNRRSSAAKVAAIDHALELEMARFRGGVARGTVEPDAYDWQPIRTHFRRVAQSDDDPTARAAAALAYFSAGFNPDDAPVEADTAVADRLIRDSPPTAAILPMAPGAVVSAARFASDAAAAQRFLDAVIDGHPVVDLGASILFNRLVDAVRSDDLEVARAASARLRTARFSGSPYVDAANRVDPDRPIKAGKTIPEFRVTAMGTDRPMVYTPRSLQGKVVLIELWATWCKPCIEEMPALHKLYTDYSDRGFEILHIALDEKKTDVLDFRRTGCSMPWLNAFPTARDREDLIARFRTSTIPLGILIDADGTIVAATPDVGTDALPALLDELLPPAPPT